MSTDDGHCRHCYGCESFWDHTNGKGAAWNAGDCPACAEAERIVKACDEMGAEIAARKPSNGPNWECRRAVRLARIGTLMDVVGIARGDT